MTILLSLLGIYILLVIATAIIYFLVKKYPQNDYIELVQRIKSWWVMVTIFSTALLLNKGVSILFFAFISFMALKEYFSIIVIRKSDRHILFLSYLVIAVQYYLALIAEFELFLTFIPIFVFLALHLRLTLMGETQKFHYAGSSISWGLILFVFFLSHMGYLLLLPPLEGSEVGGVGLVLYLVFLTQFNDVSQYVWGKIFGKYKIVPKVSKNKTWEGFLGGALTTTLLALLLSSFLTPFSYGVAIFSGLLIALSGFFGDVTISALKRDLNIKDTGTLLPGHGGILDRVDSLIYTAPLFFHFVYRIYY